LYGLHKPSSLQFDLIKLFLNKIDTVVEKSHYLVEKYESVIISALQLEGSSLIIMRDKKKVETVYKTAKMMNKFLQRKITANNILCGYYDNVIDINIISLDYFNKHYDTISRRFIDEELSFDNIFCLDMNENTKEYCCKLSNHKLLISQKNYTQHFTNTYLFVNNINHIKYKYYEKYNNNKMNKFEPNDLRRSCVYVKSYLDILNTNCIDTFYEYNSVEQAVFFINDVNQLLKIYDSLANKLYPVTMFHENMTMSEQFYSVDSFQKGESRICICTDKASLDFLKLLSQVSIDYQRISHVIHLDIPKIENYLLRIPFHIETKHIFILYLGDVYSFEEMEMLEDYFQLRGNAPARDYQKPSLSE
jgi:hypothetical protein